MQADACCRTCLAPVRWVIIGSSGLRMPLDPVGTPVGNVWVERWAASTPVVAIGSLTVPVPASAATRYTSHFVTCSRAAESRKEPYG